MPTRTTALPPLLPCWFFFAPLRLAANKIAGPHVVQVYTAAAALCTDCTSMKPEDYVRKDTRKESKMRHKNRKKKWNECLSRRRQRRAAMATVRRRTRRGTLVATKFIHIFMVTSNQSKRTTKWPIHTGREGGKFLWSIIEVFFIIIEEDKLTQLIFIWYQFPSH